MNGGHEEDIHVEVELKEDVSEVHLEVDSSVV